MEDGDAGVEALVTLDRGGVGGEQASEGEDTLGEKQASPPSWKREWGAGQLSCRSRPGARRSEVLPDSRFSHPNPLPALLPPPLAFPSAASAMPRLHSGDTPTPTPALASCRRMKWQACRPNRSCTTTREPAPDPAPPFAPLTSSASSVDEACSPPRLLASPSAALWALSTCA
jgi:hypothetical protein